MIKRLYSIHIIFLGLFLAANAGAQQYGSTDFPASGDPKAHPVFIKGLLMLHNFEYEDAREAFQEVQRMDPDFVMAYWGEALTHEHPLWHELDLAAARAVLDKLGKTPDARVARAATDREKAYIRSLNVLFGPGSETERDYAYSAALKEIYETWPDDLDAAALYALSILTTSHDGRDMEKFMRAAAITEDILDRHPRHPGALHYNIHSYDDPLHAPLGQRAAHIYSEVAPAAVHALHMPAHIYFALGQYDPANSLNQRSWQAAVDRAKAKNIPLNRQAYHSLTWLIYGRLQEGKTSEARRLLGIVEDELHSSGDVMSRMNFISARGNYIIDTGKWDDPLLDIKVDHQGLPAHIIATDQYIAGLRALETNNPAAARVVLDGFVTAKNTDSQDPRTLIPFILARMLEGNVLIAEGKVEQGLAIMQQGVDREQQLAPAIGPPMPQPAAEILGEAYLQLGDRKKAREYFNLSLQRAVNRARSLQGLQAASNQG